MIVTNTILQPFPGSPSGVSWSWSQAGERWFHLSLCLEVGSTVLQMLV